MRFRARLLGKVGLVLAIAALLAAIVMMLWNGVVTAALSGAHPIDYLHALGLLVLSRILFGGLRGHVGWNRRRQWEKWQAMTLQEREAFGQRLHACRSSSVRD
jgi:membrane protein implicated in regulation of membrane protease activity